MVSQIALCSATTARSRARLAGGCRLLARARACVGEHIRAGALRDAVCAWCGVVDGAEKVVGILLEGEKYELAARGSSNSLRARSNREEASLRQSGGAERGGREGGGVTARGCFACSHPRFAVLFKKLASPPSRLERSHRRFYRTARNQIGFQRVTERTICSKYICTSTMFCTLNKSNNMNNLNYCSSYTL